MKNVIYKFTIIKTGVLVEKSWTKEKSEDDLDYYDREQENYAFDSFEKAADWLKTDATDAAK